MSDTKPCLWVLHFPRRSVVVLNYLILRNVNCDAFWPGLSLKRYADASW